MTLASMLLVLCLQAWAAADEPAASPCVVLDTEQDSFRLFMGWRTPTLVTAAGKTAPLLEPKRRDLKDEDRKPQPMVGSTPPPADWRSLDFDDTVWPRAHGAAVVDMWYGGSIYSSGNPAEWNLVCLRGAFRVADPARVAGLRIELQYHGGAAVYVNGQALCRGHLPKGELTPVTLADPYPEETCVRPDGKQYGEGDQKEFADRMAGRVRTLPGGPVAIPASMLRKGINVIAVEVHAAPISELLVERQAANLSWRGTPTPWPHAGVLAATVTADSGAGLTPAVGPAPRLQVNVCDPMNTLYGFDFATAADAPGVVRIVAARNGTFSGRVAVSSGEPIVGLSAKLSPLVGPDGQARLPADAMQVRYAQPGDDRSGWVGAHRFDALLAEPPAEVAPAKLSLRGRKVQPAPCALVPVWVTARVPADAAAGLYNGTLTISATGAAAVEVPVELTVNGWSVPDAKNFVTHHDLYESPESVGLRYDVPIWSDRHFELIARSLRLLNQVGGRLCVLNLVAAAPNHGNSQSMVRWVRQADGSFTHDFAVLDRYLDVYEKEVGKPAICALNIWGQQMLQVTVQDKATGKLEAMDQPAYGTPENQAFWKPVLDELRKRLEKRGWFDVTAVAFTSYCYAPTKEQVDVYSAIWPDGRWMNVSHGNPTSFAGTKDKMPVLYNEGVWGCGWLYDPDGGGRFKEFPSAWTVGAARIEMANVRVGQGIISTLRDGSPTAAYRMISEAAMQGGLRGIAHQGIDFWPVVKDKWGRYGPMCNAQYAVGFNNSVMALLPAGPDGAVPGERFECFREGVQIAEAIVFLQKAQRDGRLSEQQAGRLKKLLDERARDYLRTRPGQPDHWLAFESGPWKARDQLLLALAAEAAAVPQTSGGSQQDPE